VHALALKEYDQNWNPSYLCDNTPLRNHSMGDTQSLGIFRRLFIYHNLGNNILLCCRLSGICINFSDTLAFSQLFISEHARKQHTVRRYRGYNLESDTEDTKKEIQRGANKGMKGIF